MHFYVLDSHRNTLATGDVTRTPWIADDKAYLNIKPVKLRVTLAGIPKIYEMRGSDGTVLCRQPWTNEPCNLRVGDDILFGANKISFGFKPVCCPWVHGRADEWKH